MKLKPRPIHHLKDYQLVKLRKEIVLGSLFLDDYENSFGISREDTFSFFDGYVDYLYDMAHEDGYKPLDNFDCFAMYDTPDNLCAWREIVACGAGC